LRRDGNFSGRRVGRNELYFVDADRTLVLSHRFFDLLRNVLRLRSTSSESPHQAREISHRNFRGKMNARETRCRQQLRETAFSLARLEWNAVQQKLVTGNSQQKSGVAGFR